jgi:flagellar capping protein FliD
VAGIRIGGLASGMDIDQLVSDLMKAERIPLDKLSQKKQYTEWQRDDYREMNKALFEFDQLIFDGILKQGSYIKKSVYNSNPDAVSIRNVTSTADFSGTIEVTSLASAASMYSTSSSGLNSTDKLSTQGITGTKLTIQSIGKNGVLETADVSIDPLNDTIETVISKINTQTGVSAYYDKTKGTLSLIAKNTGDVTGPEIVLGGDSNFWSALKMEANNETATSLGAGTLGANAKLKYNGMPIERSSNTFNINGVEFTLKNKTTQAVTFSSTTDTEAVLDTIVKFVDKYNSLIEKIKGELEEKRYRDFQPLTSEQKDSMDEKDIERWEEKAKSGTLRGDSVLSNSLNEMRMNLYTAVPGLTGFDQLAEIGIKTSKNYQDGGKLIIDPEKLKAAIAENPNSIYELFSKEGTGDNQGIGRRLRATIKTTMANIEQRAGKATSSNNAFTLGRNLESLDKQINRFEDRLVQIESRYWRQFTAMEKAIQRANSQSMYLMQQFGG